MILEAEPSPLFQKLDKLAMDIGKVGMAVASFCLLACVMGFLSMASHSKNSHSSI